MISFSLKPIGGPKSGRMIGKTFALKLSSCYSDVVCLSLRTDSIQIMYHDIDIYPQKS